MEYRDGYGPFVEGITFATRESGVEDIRTAYSHSGAAFPVSGDMLRVSAVMAGCSRVVFNRLDDLVSETAENRKVRNG